jgi:MFS family permease
LLPVAPLLGSERGVHATAGLVTAALMGGTVAMQVSIPALSRRMSVVAMLVLGGVLMGLPSFAYLGSPSEATILVASALRGIGFGLVTIGSTAVVIRMAAEGVRARAIGRFGLLTGMIAALSPAVGVRLYDVGQDTLLFCLAGALPVAGIAVLPYAYLGTLRRSLRAPRILPLLRTGALVRPTLVFALGIISYGALVSYLPQSFAGSAALMLLLFGVVQALFRGLAGRLPAGAMQHHLLLVAAAAALSGVLLLWWATRVASTALAYTGLLWLGVGLGMLATASLAALAGRGTDRSQIGPSVLWNVAFDAGIAAGGILFALAAHSNSSSSVYALCALLLAGAVVIALQDGRRQRLADSS